MNLLKALATVSAMTLISRILGFVRDTVIARAFGESLKQIHGRSARFEINKAPIISSLVSEIV